MSFNISSSLVPISDATASYVVQRGQEVLEVQETPEETQLPSYADLTMIQVDSSNKNKIKELSDPIKKEIRGTLANTWYRIFNSIQNEIYISITDAVLIHHISKKNDIFEFNSDSIKKIPVTDKKSELTALRKLLLSKRLLKAELGPALSASIRAIIRSQGRQQCVVKTTAETLDSVYKKHMEGRILFDFDSVLSKAVQEAKNQIEKKYPQFSSASKKRPPSDESISLQVVQPPRKKSRSDNTAKIDLSAEQDDQQQRPLEKSFKTSEAMQSSSYADLTTFTLSPNNREKIKKISRPIQKELREIFGKSKWKHFILDTESISIKDAVVIHQISGNKDIFDLKGDIPIVKIPVIDKLDEVQALRDSLHRQKLSTLEPGRLCWNIFTHDQKSVTKETAEKLNSAYMKYVEEGKVLFNFNSIVSKAIREAENQVNIPPKEYNPSLIEQIETDVLQQQNPQPIGNLAFSSQREQYPVGMIEGQYYQNTPYNPSLFQQQYHQPVGNLAFSSQREQYPVGMIEGQYYQNTPYNPSLFQQQYHQPVGNLAFSSQREQYPVGMIEGQYYQNTPYNPSLFQQQNPQPVGNLAFLYQQVQRYDHHKTQYNAHLIQQQNYQHEQNNVVPSQQGLNPQYDDSQIEQPETNLPQDQVKQQEQTNDDQIQKLLSETDGSWIDNL